jgi:hypothetical protein
MVRRKLVNSIKCKFTLWNYSIRIKYLSWLGYANEILVVNQWENIQSIYCDKISQNTILTTLQPRLETTPGIIPRPECLFNNGQSVIDRSGMKTVGLF